MTKEQRRDFWNLARITSKFSEEDLKDPQNQAIMNGYLALKEEYLALIDPAKREKMQEVMDLNKSLQVLGASLNAFLQSSLEKPFPAEEVEKAFGILVVKVQEKVAEK